MNGEYSDIDDEEPKRLLRGVKKLLKRRMPIGRSPPSKKGSGKRKDSADKGGNEKKRKKMR